VPALSSEQLEIGTESLNVQAQATALGKAVAALDGWNNLFGMGEF